MRETVQFHVKSSEAYNSSSGVSEEAPFTIYSVNNRPGGEAKIYYDYDLFSIIWSIKAIDHWLKLLCCSIS